MTLKEIYIYGKQNLPEPDESLILCEELYQKNRQDIIMTPNFVIENTEIFFDAVNKRIEGMPLQYILGYWEFDSLKLKVKEGVLIPREDTMVLVDCATSFIKDKKMVGIDLCSGTGAVALAIAQKCINVNIDALELYPVPCECLMENIKTHSKNQVKFKKADVFTAFEGYDNLDFIVSNPPYIESAEIPTLQIEVQQEPHTALDGGQDGLDFYKAICSEWSKKIKIKGLLAVEIGETQGQDVMDLFKQNGFENIEIIKDFNNLDRVIFGFKAR